ncbi:hypothetical protein DFP72DRAFT_1046892 [Ephemerocybe angulata]|uniref:Uncharacterized protein n=1 Tax=Ephemerocybe angulata TaxID=980116 RepID=A0A8H6HTU2_9AGAR|nr:hypothetical protein DFP72DRAFT_1046892 [Tulosesus angulatus]
MSGILPTEILGPYERTIRIDTMSSGSSWCMSCITTSLGLGIDVVLLQASSFKAKEIQAGVSSKDLHRFKKILKLIGVCRLPSYRNAYLAPWPPLYTAMLSLGARSGSQTSVISIKDPGSFHGSLILQAPSKPDKKDDRRHPEFPPEILEQVIEFYFEGHAPFSLRLLHDHVKNLRLCSRLFNQTNDIDLQLYTLARSSQDLGERDERRGKERKGGWFCVGPLFGIAHGPTALCDSASMNGIVESSRPGPAPNAQVVLHSLKLFKVTRLPCIDTYLLRAIARAFPNLVSLELECTGRLKRSCCQTCYEDSLTLTVHSPVPRKYRSAEDLAHAFGEALKPLSSLKSIYLGIFLSPEDTIERHALHYEDPPADLSDDEEMDDNLGRLYPDSLAKCEVCLSSNSFQRRYGSLEFLQNQEMRATLRMAQHIKSLENMAWDSCCQGVPVWPKSKVAEDESAQAPHKLELNAEKSGDGHDALDSSQGSVTSSQSFEGSSSTPGASHKRHPSESFKIEFKVTRDIMKNRVRVTQFNLQFPTGRNTYCSNSSHILDAYED